MGTAMTTAQELVRRAGGRCGYVFTSAELGRMGIHPMTAARLVRSGDWQRLWWGVYLCAPHAPSALQRAHAAVKHAQSGTSPTLVTGLAGAAALGMRWVPKHTRVQVLVAPHVQRSSNDGVLLRRTWDVAAVETWNWGGLSVAEATRLVVDGARECASLTEVRGLALGAIADSHTGPEALRRVLDAAAVGGTAWLRRSVRDAERGAASPAEAEVIDVLIGRGRPFVANAEVHVGDAFVGRLDGYLLGTGVGFEVDSRERHASAFELSATLQRHEGASRQGLSLVHVTPTSFRADPGDFLRRLDDEVAHRQAAGLGEPPGLVIRAPGPVLR
jgi:hypothetical protein